MCNFRLSTLTFNARVLGTEVLYDVLVTVTGAIQVGMRYCQLTAPSTRTVPVNDMQNIRLATQVTKVHIHALADAHAAVDSALHQYHLALGTRWFELLG